MGFILHLSPTLQAGCCWEMTFPGGPRHGLHRGSAPPARPALSSANTRPRSLRVALVESGAAGGASAGPALYVLRAFTPVCYSRHSCLSGEDNMGKAPARRRHPSRELPGTSVEDRDRHVKWLSSMETGV